ncbi:MAG: RcnB family protein [Rhodoferax sp.]|nr:RcnB family protein [Rhodoferax sp.]MCB2004933.1 RcnB family protein [Rhodoferax sp.]MCB2041080.1 RcnB family protein [Rhodoferax sp.]MCP5262303.1 RcnB family protein [Rhodoferax sp.]
MNQHLFLSIRPLAVVLAMALSCGGALATKPDGDDHGKNRSKKQKHSEVVRAQVPVGGYFIASQRVAVTTYYGQQRKAGHCPPGLAKKNNGCLPPGQARKWQLGQALPGTVVLHPVPQAVIVKIGAPPAGYRYVRVANDLLLIAIGTQIVVDAIEDLMAL